MAIMLNSLPAVKFLVRIKKNTGSVNFRGGMNFGDCAWKLELTEPVLPATVRMLIRLL